MLSKFAFLVVIDINGELANLQFAFHKAVQWRLAARGTARGPTLPAGLKRCV